MTFNEMELVQPLLQAVAEAGFKFIPGKLDGEWVGIIHRNPSWREKQAKVLAFAQFLFQRIEDPDTTPCNMLIGVKLLRRGSTVPARTPEMPPKR